MVRDWWMMGDAVLLEGDASPSKRLEQSEATMSRMAAMSRFDRGDLAETVARSFARHADPAGIGFDLYGGNLVFSSIGTARPMGGWLNTRSECLDQGTGQPGRMRSRQSVRLCRVKPYIPKFLSQSAIVGALCAMDVSP